MTLSNNNDVLQYAIAQGIINLQDVQEQIIMKRDEEILANHPYKIWKNEKSGKWYTHILDDDAVDNRRKIKLSSEASLNQAIIKAYLEREEKEKLAELIQPEQLEIQKPVILTIEELYPVWLKFKSSHTNATSYIKRIAVDWKRYYLNDDLIKIPLKSLSKTILDEWVHNKIKEFGFTKNQYFNMSIILRQGLQYAMDEKYIDINPFEKVKVSAKMYKKERKKDDATQVYLLDEQPKVEKLAYEDFDKTGNVLALSIPLAFQIGTRIGELVAIKESDIENGYLHIQRMEVLEFHTDDGIQFNSEGFRVAEHAKTDAGDRYIFLSSKAREIIELIIRKNRECNHCDDGYLFISKITGMRAHEPSVSRLLRKYCRKLDIIEGKGMHKIRKTFISLLIDNGLNINEIRKTVGHEDERTTYKSYCFNRMSDRQTESFLENILCGKVEQIPNPDPDTTGKSNIIQFLPKKGNQSNQKVCVQKKKS